MCIVMHKCSKTYDVMATNSESSIFSISNIQSFSAQYDPIFDFSPKVTLGCGDGEGVSEEVGMFDSVIRVKE